MNKYKILIKTHKTFAILCIIQAICYFGVWFSHTGVFTLLIELKAPVWAITITAALAFIPGVIIAPFSGAIIDKIKPKTILMASLIIEAVSVLMLTTIDNLSLLWLLFIIVFIRVGVGGISFQAQMSLLPKILNQDQLKPANEIHSIIWAVAYTAGMSLAGLYVHFFGVISAFLLDFILFVIAAILLSFSNINIKASTNSDTIISLLKSGLKYLKSNPLVLNLIFLHSFVGLTAYDVLVALLAEYSYAKIISIPLAIGFTNGIRALALTIGPATLSRITNNKTLPYLYTAQGIGIILWACFQFNFYLAFIGLFVAGFFTSTLWSYTYTILQQNTHEKFYGRIIAYNDMIFLGIGSFTSLGIGWLFDLGMPLSFVTAIIGIMFLVGAFYAKWIFKRFTTV